jgi:CheY-like chemotaxis protein
MTLSSSERGTVLVVEDDPWTRTIEEALLGSEGYRVLSAKNGEEGLLLAGKHHPNVILLDVALPNMSGLEVLSELKSTEGTSNIPVIIVSAYANLAGTMGAQGAVQKPFDYDELLSGLDRFVPSHASPSGHRQDLLSSI